MGKLRVLSGKAVCEILERHDSAEVRRRGSHVLMQRANSDGSTTTLAQINMVRRLKELGIVDDVVIGGIY